MQPNDDVASVIVNFNPSVQNNIGSSICVNENLDGNIGCPVIGKVTHFGRVEGTGLDLASQPKITGPIIASAGGWFIHFNDGTPKLLTLTSGFNN